MVDMSLLLRPVHHDVWHHEVPALDQQHGVLGLEHLKGLQHLVISSRVRAKQKRLEVFVSYSLVPIPHPERNFAVVPENVLKESLKKMTS